MRGDQAGEEDDRGEQHRALGDEEAKSAASSPALIRSAADCRLLVMTILSFRHHPAA